jgi:hypothetical protein
MARTGVIRIRFDHFLIDISGALQLAYIIEGIQMKPTILVIM